MRSSIVPVTRSVSISKTATPESAPGAGSTVVALVTRMAARASERCNRLFLIAAHAGAGCERFQGSGAVRGSRLYGSGHVTVCAHAPVARSTHFHIRAD